MEAEETTHHDQEDQFYQLLSSPIQCIHRSDQHKDSHEYSSEAHNQFSHSFRQIAQQNEDQVEKSQTHLCDLLGNPICQFETQQVILDFPPIFQDKENSNLVKDHQTPLKNKQIRSPFKDITPSMTKRKKKHQKSILTPKTMAESRFGYSSGLRRI